MKHIVCDAVAFGSGPASKLVSILAELAESSVRITILADNSSYEFLQHCHSGAIVRCDTDDIASLREAVGSIDNPDIFLNVMNPLSAGFFRSLGVPVATVDSLFWMWNAVPREMAESDRYYIQRFGNVEERVESEGSRIANPRVVGPIISPRLHPYGDRGSDTVLVNLGGMTSGLASRGDVSRYLRLVVETISQVALRVDCKFTVAMGGNALEKIDISELHPRLHFLSLSPEDFQGLLMSSVAIISSPGLTTTLEAFATRTPLFFLPPQNYSQSLIVSQLIDIGLVTELNGSSVHYPEFHVPAFLDEAEGVARVHRGLDKFLNESGSIAQLADDIVTFLEARSSGQILSETRLNYFHSLGTNGAVEVAEDLIRTLCGASPS